MLCRAVVLVGLGDPGRAPKCYAQITEYPQYQLGGRVLYVKAKSLYSYKYANSDSPCVQHIGVVREPPAQLGLGFYSSIDWVRDF